MFRNVIAVIIGIVAGMALNMGIVEIAARCYPLPIPEGLDINDPAQLQNYVNALPALAFLVVMVAHLPSPSAAAGLPPGSDHRAPCCWR